MHRGLILHGWLMVCLLGGTFCSQAAEQEAGPRGLLNPSALDREVDAAVARATQFLAREQRPSGGWFLDLYSGETTSATSLALMSLLAAGHVPGDEPYKLAFERGHRYLREHQQASGMIVDRTGHGPLYCHGISTLYLAEVLGMAEPVEADMLRVMLERAVRALLEAQVVPKGRRHAGGWRYTLGSTDSDLSVTAWQLLALRAAKNAGCDVPAEAIDAAVAYVKQCYDHEGAGGFAYQPGSGGTPIMTAAGVTALQVCGAADTPECRLAVPTLVLRPPSMTERHALYGAYYLGVALHQHGGDPWETTREKLYRRLLDRQLPDGSLVSGDDSEKQTGKVYCTSLAVLALTVEYGYLPIYQK